MQSCGHLCWILAVVKCCWILGLAEYGHGDTASLMAGPWRWKFMEVAGKLLDRGLSTTCCCFGNGGNWTGLLDRGAGIAISIGLGRPPDPLLLWEWGCRTYFYMENGAATSGLLCWGCNWI
ncbi:unnamed protein product [Cuscuta campestris]|uniref:Secreted protein n=1 Tax=Cuscuta campestris TaxID=132261 RepID=A0A484NL91_9ASTE|nr:unnamed protein product [Cuscuta campestris]